MCSQKKSRRTYLKYPVKKREIVRQQYVNYEGDFSLAVRLEKLLYIFDSIMSDRAWGNKTEGFPKHIVHGWYLPSDDS